MHETRPADSGYRARINALTETVLRSVEKQGPVREDGTVNPAAELLAALLNAGNGLRSVAAQRHIAYGERRDA
jgi:hypothetical protein